MHPQMEESQVVETRVIQQLRKLLTEIYTLRLIVWGQKKKKKRQGVNPGILTLCTYLKGHTHTHIFACLPLVWNATFLPALFSGRMVNLPSRYHVFLWTGKCKDRHQLKPILTDPGLLMKNCNANSGWQFCLTFFKDNESSWACLYTPSAPLQGKLQNWSWGLSLSANLLSNDVIVWVPSKDWHRMFAYQIKACMQTLFFIYFLLVLIYYS